MIGSKCSHTNSKSALIERLRLQIPALPLIEVGQVVETNRCNRMFRPQLPLADRQGAQVQRLRLRIPCTYTQVVCCLIEQTYCFWRNDLFLLYPVSAEECMRQTPLTRLPLGALHVGKRCIDCKDCSLPPLLPHLSRHGVL